MEPLAAGTFAVLPWTNSLRPALLQGSFFPKLQDYFA